MPWTSTVCTYTANRISNFASRGSYSVFFYFYEHCSCRRCLSSPLVIKWGLSCSCNWSNNIIWDQHGTRGWAERCVLRTWLPSSYIFNWSLVHRTKHAKLFVYLQYCFNLLLSCALKSTGNTKQVIFFVINNTIKCTVNAVHASSKTIAS